MNSLWTTPSLSRKTISIAFLTVHSICTFFGCSSPAASHSLVLLLGSGSQEWNQDSSWAISVSIGFPLCLRNCQDCWDIFTWWHLSAAVSKWGTHFAGLLVSFKFSFKIRHVQLNDSWTSWAICLMVNLLLVLTEAHTAWIFAGVLLVGVPDLGKFCFWMHLDLKLEYHLWIELLLNAFCLCILSNLAFISFWDTPSFNMNSI